MNKIIESLIVKYEQKTREITDEYINNNVQILISPLLYLLDSGVTEIKSGDDLEYKFYNLTDTDGYISRLSKALIPNYMFYKGYIDELNAKHIVFKSEINQSIGNPGKYLYGAYEESSNGLSYTLSWFDDSEDNSVKPKSLFCVQNGKCHAIINHGASYNIICGNKECYVGINELLPEEKQGIEDLLRQYYELVNVQTSIPAVRAMSEVPNFAEQNAPYNVRFDCSFVEKTIWEHNVDPPGQDDEENMEQGAEDGK